MLGVVAVVVLSQGPPATDIYVARLRTLGGRLEVGAPVNFTMRPGYDNQPMFLPDAEALLYTVVDGQADVFRLRLDSARGARVTATPESEYSPTPLPDGSGFSVVRVEADSTQRLWRFNWDGQTAAVVLPDVKPVGYHAWADAHTVALFVLGAPPTLQLVDVRTGAAAVVATDVGRGVARVPGRAAISYVQREGDTTWSIMEVDLGTRATRRLVRTLTRVDLFAWTPDGVLLMAQGAKVYQWHPTRAPEWEAIADFSDQGLTNITRLAVSPRGDLLALVAADRPR